MKKKQIIIAVVVVLLIIGGIFIAKGSSSKDKSSTSKSSSSSNSNNKSDGGFNAIANTDQSFVATITSTIGDKSYVATMESDAKTGAVKYVSNAQGENMTFIYTKDTYYMCMSATKCYKYKLGEGSGATFDPSSYKYDSTKLDEYKSTSTSGGTKACKAGTCDVWKVKAGNYESLILIDQRTKRVSEVQSTTAAGGSTIVYEYKDVSVEIPTTAEEVPTGIPVQ